MVEVQADYSVDAMLCHMGMHAQQGMGDIHLGKRSSHELVCKLVARYLNFFPQIDLSTKKANPEDQKD